MRTLAFVLAAVSLGCASIPATLPDAKQCKALVTLAADYGCDFIPEPEPRPEREATRQ
jgi:hypothetical protein